MQDIFFALENSAFSLWLRESDTIWAYPTVLTLHTVGLALLVGSSTALNLRLLGWAPRIPLAALVGSFRVMWLGLSINAVTGAMLFAADASARGTGRLFGLKMLLVIGGVLLAVALQREVRGHLDAGTTSGRVRALATASLLTWVAAITAGRLLAYV